MNTTSNQGLNQAGPVGQAGPSTDPRDTGSSDSQQELSQKEAARPIPWGTGKEDDAAPASDGKTKEDPRPKDGVGRQGDSGESPTGGDPRTPNIPGT